MDGNITDFTTLAEKWTNITKGDIPTLAMSYIMYKIGIQPFFTRLRKVTIVGIGHG